jgi:hypothetical protein
MTLFIAFIFFTDALKSSVCITVRLKCNEMENMGKELLYQQTHKEYLKYVTIYLNT